MSDNKELIAQLKRRAEAAEVALKQLREENKELTEQLKQLEDKVVEEDTEEDTEEDNEEDEELQPLPDEIRYMLASTLRLWLITEDGVSDINLNPIDTDYDLLNDLINKYDMSAGFLLDIMRLCVIRKYEYLEVEEGYNDAERDFELEEIQDIYERLEDNLPELRKETKKRLLRVWISSSCGIDVLKTQ